MISRDVDVIKYMMENKDQELNISTISKGLKLDYKNGHEMAMRLAKKGIISLNAFGKSLKATLNVKPNPLVYEAEYLRRNEVSKDIKTIIDYYDRNMKSNFYIMLLFGSYAKKTATKHSDIDLLFIVPDESKIEKNIEQIAAMLPLDIHLNIFEEKDFVAMKDSKKITVGSEAMKNNVILHGIEAYYSL